MLYARSSGPRLLGFVWGTLFESMEPRSTPMEDGFELLTLMVEDMLSWFGKGPWSRVVDIAGYSETDFDG